MKKNSEKILPFFLFFDTKKQKMNSIPSVFFLFQFSEEEGEKNEQNKKIRNEFQRFTFFPNF
jgi:hypothetical protein